MIPGFGITLGVTLTWLSLIVLIPLSGLFLKTAELSPERFLAIMTSRRVLHALELSFGLSLLAALVNLVFGLVIVWALVRYEFPGRRILDAIIDIPFALPTAVAGIALTNLYAENGWIGALLAPLGIQVAFTPLGIFVALVFIGLPFVVRTVQPVLEDIEAEVEEAAATLGASRWHDHPPGDVSGTPAGAADRLRARVRPRGRRIRLGHLHCRQPAERLRDRAAADRHPAGGVPLCGRDRDRRRDAGCLFILLLAINGCSAGPSDARAAADDRAAPRRHGARRRPHPIARPHGADVRADPRVDAVGRHRDRRSRFSPCSSFCRSSTSSSQAFSQGAAAPIWSAIDRADALAAIRLTLLVAAISVAAEPRLRRDRRLGHRQVRVPRARAC